MHSSPRDVLQHLPVELRLRKDSPCLDDAHGGDAQVVVWLTHELGQPLVAVAEGIR